MGLDHQITFLATQIAWSLPVLITVVVIGAIAVVRRDGALWWKLVVGGAAAIVLAQLVSSLGTFLIAQLDNGYRFYWVASAPAVLLNVVGLALLGAGAISGRRQGVQR